jgi:ribosomal protein S18 acetylase RimI-like enzyme
MPVTGPRPRSDAGVRLTTERGTQLLLDDRLDELEPLWLSLFDHHQSVHPGPYRARDDSWPHRRRQYEAWLADPEAFAVVARQDGSAVGYALVAMHDGPDDSWPTGHRYAEVETLVVDPQVRGRSVGTALLDAVDSELRALGVDVLAIGVVDGNDEARRLYERRGFRPMVTKLMRFTGQPGGPVA